jgi:hypothetical protein
MSTRPVKAFVSQAMQQMAAFLVDLPTRWAGRRIMLIGHRVTYRALEHVINGLTVHGGCRTLLSTTMRSAIRPGSSAAQSWMADLAVAGIDGVVAKSAHSRDQPGFASTCAPATLPWPPSWHRTSPPHRPAASTSGRSSGRAERHGSSSEGVGSCGDGRPPAGDHGRSCRVRRRP